MKKKKVTIIVPVYNVEKYIGICIDSLSNQSYKNCEFIIVDDGSTDNSKAVILSKMKNDSRIKYINQKNSGVSSARNNGINHASGEYLIFVDGDDYISEDFVEYMLALIDDGEFGFSLENYKRKNEKQTQNIFVKKIDSEEACGYLLSPNVTVGCWNKIYKLSFLKKNNLYFDEKLFYGEGLQYIIKCALMAKKIYIGNKKVYYYRKNNNKSATTIFSIDKIYNGEKSIKKLSRQINLDNLYVCSMYTLHLATYYAAAIVNIKGRKKKNEYKFDYKRWKKYIEDNLLFILKNKYISRYRKCLILFSFIFPSIIYFADIYRRKRIFKNSI